MNEPRACARHAALLGALLVCSAPVQATRQCPPEFGPKDPLVDVFGWGVVAVGFVLGALLLRFVVRRSRGQRWHVRLTATVLGFVGAALVGFGAFAAAVAFFFFRC